MPKITCAIAPSGAGRIRHLPGLAANPLASANCRAAAGSAPLIASQFALVAKVMGMALVAGAVSNTAGMLVSGWALRRGVPATYTRLARRDRFPSNQHFEEREGDGLAVEHFRLDRPCHRGGPGLRGNPSLDLWPRRHRLHVLPARPQPARALRRAGQADRRGAQAPGGGLLSGPAGWARAAD